MRRVGSNRPYESNIEKQALTDYAPQAYEHVMRAANKAYGAAQQGLAAEAQVAGQEYARQKREINARERGRASTMGGIGDIGKALVSGFLGLQEIQERRANQEQEWELRLRQEERADRKLEMQELQHQEKQDLEILEMMTNDRVNEIKTDYARYASEGAAQQGIAHVESEYQQLLESDEFKMLSPKYRMYFAHWARKGLADLRTNTRDELKTERREVINAKTEQAYQLWRASDMSLVESLDDYTMSEAQVSGRISSIMGNLTRMVDEDPELSAYMMHRPARLALTGRVLGDIAGKLESRYRQTGEAADLTHKFTEAAGQLSALEAARDAQAISQGDYTFQAGRVLTSLGFNSDPSQFPTAQVNVLEEQMRTLEQTHKFGELMAKDEVARELLGEGTPKGEALRRVSRGDALFSMINGGQVEAEITRLESLLKTAPERASLMDAPVLVGLLKEFNGDRNKIVQIEQKIADTNKQIAEYGYKYTLPNVETISRDSLGLKPPELQIISAPKDAEGKPIRVQQMPPGGMEALQEKLVSIQREYAMVTVKWRNYGIDVLNPSNQKYLSELKTKNQAVVDYANQLADSKGISGTINPEDLVTPQVTGTPAKIGNHVLHEFRENGGLDEVKAGGTGAYSEFFNRNAESVVQAAATGRLAEAERLVKTLEERYMRSPEAKVLAGISPETLTASQVKAKKDQRRLFTIMNWAKQKGDWYRQKLGERTTRDVPRGTTVNFSQGSRERATRLPQNEAPAQPAVATSGLATHKGLGYTPFKGGRVTLTSDYGADRGTHRHHGIDLVSSDPRVATVQGGRVVFAANWGTYGNVVGVKTPDGHTEVYAHLDSIRVRKGDNVPSGHVVGIMGNTGRSDGAHLHFEVWSAQYEDFQSVADRRYVPPNDYLRRVALKWDNPRGFKVNNLDPSRPRINSGVYNIGRRLVYSHGYVIDLNTNTVRRANPRETPKVPEEHRPLSEPRNAKQQAIHQMGKDLGVDPLDIATVMSFESAGTMSPDIWGGDGGRYLGLIQMSPSNQRQYGVRPGMGFAAYCKAATRYLKDRGVKPGMSRANIYAAILRGRAHLVDGLTDSNGTSVGGALARRDQLAPGGDHERAARRFLGGSSPRPNNRVYRNQPLEVPKMSIFKNSYGRNDVEKNYGYTRLMKDRGKRTELVQAANKLGIPAQWLADTLMSPHATFNVQAEADKLAKLVSKSGKKVSTIEDVAAFLMGGERGFLMSPNQRRSLNNNGVSWTKYLDSLGKSVGRGYDFSHSWNRRIIHSHQRDNCPICNSMKRTGHFAPHYAQ